MAAIEVPTQLGPGLLESAYEHILAYEPTPASLLGRTQGPLPLIYKTIHLAVGYRIDLLVENRVVVKIKSVETVSEVHKLQLLSCLRLSSHKLSLLLHFNAARLKGGIHRRVSGFWLSASLGGLSFAKCCGDFPNN